MARQRRHMAETNAKWLRLHFAQCLVARQQEQKRGGEAMAATKQCEATREHQTMVVVGEVRESETMTAHSLCDDRQDGTSESHGSTTGRLELG